MQNKREGVPKVGTPYEILISFKSFGYHLPHFLAQRQRFEYLDAITVSEQFAKKIGRGADVEGEICIVVGRCQLALGVMQG